MNPVKEKYLTLLKTFTETYKKNPTTGNCSKELPDLSSFRHHFGSWNNALVLAGLPVNQNAKRESHKLNCENCKKEILIHNNAYERSLTKRFFCSKSCAAQYNNLKRIRSEDSKKKTSLAILSSDRVAKARETRRQKSLENLLSSIKHCPMCGVNFKVYRSFERTYCSRECYLRDSELHFRTSGPGGLRHGSGRGKHGRYKGYWCDSTWELAWVLWCLDKDLPFERNHQAFPYFYNGQQRNYYPDFIVDGIYIEIKGFITEQHKAKIEAFPYPIIVLGKNEMRPILFWAKNKFETKLQKLFDPKTTK